MRHAASGIAMMVPALVLGACGGDGPEGAEASRRIACGPVHTEPARRCTLEVTTGDDETLFLTVRDPDGGFRRLTWPKGGALAAADGAEPLEATYLPGGGVDARIGGWLFRIQRRDAQ